MVSPLPALKDQSSLVNLLELVVTFTIRATLIQIGENLFIVATIAHGQ